MTKQASNHGGNSYGFSIDARPDIPTVPDVATPFTHLASPGMDKNDLRREIHNNVQYEVRTSADPSALANPSEGTDTRSPVVSSEDVGRQGGDKEEARNYQDAGTAKPNPDPSPNPDPDSDTNPKSSTDSADSSEDARNSKGKDVNDSGSEEQKEWGKETIEQYSHLYDLLMSFSAGHLVATDPKRREIDILVPKKPVEADPVVVVRKNEAA